MQLRLIGTVALVLSTLVFSTSAVAATDTNPSAVDIPWHCNMCNDTDIAANAAADLALD